MKKKREKAREKRAARDEQAPQTQLAQRGPVPVYFDDEEDPEQEPVRVNVRHRGRNTLIALLLLLVTVAVLLVLNSKVFLVRQVLITGNQTYDAQEIIDSSGIQLDTPLLRVDRAAAREGIERNAYLAVDKISIRLPDTVSIQLHERTPVAMVRYLDSDMLMDKQGIILQVLTRDSRTDMIRIDGIRATSFRAGKALTSDEPGQIELALTCLDLIEQEGLAGQIVSMDLVDPLNIRLFTKENIEIRLGGRDELQGKLRVAATVLAELMGEGKVGGVLEVTSTKAASYLAPGAGTPPTTSPENSPSPETSASPGGEPQTSASPEGSAAPGDSEPPEPTQSPEGSAAPGDTPDAD